MAGSGRELEELVEGIMELALLLTERFKDGAQAEDVMAIFMALQSNPKFKAAITGLGGLKEDVAGFDAARGVDVAVKVLSYVPKILELVKK